MLSKLKKVLIGPSSFGDLDPTPVQMLRQAGYEVVDNPYKRKLTKEELLKLLPGVNGLIAGLEILDQEVLKNSELKVISRCGSGMSNVDLKAAAELGILVRNTPAAPAIAVAELTIGCLLALLRQVTQMDLSLHQRKWDKRIGRQLNGKKVAVIGFGNIGRKVGKLILAFGAEVLAVDPQYGGDYEGIPAVDLKTAIEQADIITLHCSGENCLLGENEFGIMKKGVYILNAARGDLIDEAALKSALDKRLVAGAWLDTFNREPYNGALCDYPQVILTPHVGSYSLECRKAMEIESVNNLVEAFNKGMP